MLDFRDKCTIKRRSFTDQAYGRHDDFEPVPELTGIPCRLITKSQKGVNMLTNELVVDTVHHLQMTADRQVFEGDIVTDLVLDATTEATPMIKENGQAIEFEIFGGVILKRSRVTAIKTANLKVLE